MTTFLLGITSTDAIEIYPEFDFKNGRTKIEQEHRLQNGDLYAYKTGIYEKFNFTTRFVPASEASIVNSWWQGNTKLLFWIDTDVSSVMLRGDSFPFDKYQKPYTDLMQGTIKLEGY